MIIEFNDKKRKYNYDVNLYNKQDGKIINIKFIIIIMK